MGSHCDGFLRGTLRSASNVYFAHVHSAIHLPRGNDQLPSRLFNLLETPPLSSLMSLLRDTDDTVHIPKWREVLRTQHPDLLGQFTDGEIEGTLEAVTSANTDEHDEQSSGTSGDTYSEAFRLPEFSVLRGSSQEDDLAARRADLAKYDDYISKHFETVGLIHKLRETRALAGFTRVFPDNDQSLAERKRLLRRHWDEADSWLPAIEVYGEGIFLELSPDKLHAWEGRDDVRARVEPVRNLFGEMLGRGRLRDRQINSRFVLLHTFLTS